MFERIPAALALILCTGASAQAITASEQTSEQATSITIPPGPLTAALQTVAERMHVQLLYNQREIEGIPTPGVLNAKSTEEAIDSLLQGTRLRSRKDASGAILIASASMPTSSNDAEGQLEEVRVSARRRDESEKDVPVSMVVKSGEALEKSHVENLSELERVVPGLVYQGLSISYYPSIYLRGIGTSSISSGVDPSVGIALDGVISARTSALAGNFDDIERIEVLRGPQGTLFGKNSSAGLISLVTKDPTETLTGDVSAGYGSYAEKKLSGAISGPLIDETLLGRISAYGDRRDGYLKNDATGRDVLDDDQKGARGSLLFRPFDATELRFRAYWTGRHNNWGHSILPVRYLGALSTPGERAQSDIAGPTNDTVRTSGDGYYLWYQKSAGSTLQWDQKLGDYTLTSISAYQGWLWQQRLHDLGNAPTPYPLNVYGDFDNRTAQWSQELRLASPTDGRFDYVAGLYYYQMRNNGWFHQLVMTSQTRASAQEGNNRVDTLSYAAFGEANFHLNDETTLIAGVRWSNEEKELFIASDPLPVVPGVLVEGSNINNRIGTVSDSVSASNWSWRLGARWEPSPERMLYATASHGHKGPGYNSLTSTAVQRVKPEFATTFEIGSKSSFFDRRLSANVALYHSVFRDYQADGTRTTLNADNVQINTVMLSNAGKVRTRGVELELLALPTDSLTLSFNGAYTDAVYEEFLNFPCYLGQSPAAGCMGALDPVRGTGGSQTLTGQHLNITPKVSGTFGFDYELGFGAALPFQSFVRADYSWRDDVQWNRDNNPATIEPSYGLLGASIELRDRAERYSFTLYGKNLTDKYHFGGNGGTYSPQLGTAYGSLGPDFQRIWGATFRYNY